MKTDLRILYLNHSIQFYSILFQLVHLQGHWFRFIVCSSIYFLFYFSVVCCFTYFIFHTITFCEWHFVFFFVKFLKCFPDEIFVIPKTVYYFYTHTHIFDQSANSKFVLLTLLLCPYVFFCYF